MSGKGKGSGEKTPKRRVGRPKGRIPEGQGDPRLRMLDAAAELFAVRGVAKTSVAMVAKLAGYTPAAVHYHFNSRAALLDEVIRLKLGPLMEFVWSALDAEAGDPVAAALEVTRRIFAIGVENPWLPPLWLGEIVAGDGMLKKFMVKRIPKDKVVSFAALLSRGQREGKINPGLEPRLVVLNLLGMTMFALGTREFWGILRMGGEPLAEETVLRHAEAMLLHGLAVPAGGRRKGGV